MNFYQHPNPRSVSITVGFRGSRYQQRVVTVESQSVEALTELSQQEFINDLNTWTSRGHLQLITLTASAVVLLVAILANFSAKSILGLLVCGVAFAVARTIEFRRRQYSLVYDLESDVTAWLAVLEEALASLSRSGSLESVQYHDVHGDWKRHAGATRTVHSEDAYLCKNLPRHVTSNLTPICLRVQRKSLYFFPDRLLVEELGRFAAISYETLSAEYSTSNMRWYSRVPTDCVEVGSSWKYVNRNNTPDLRFKDNFRVPIILVGELRLASETGLRIVLQSSATKATKETSAALNIPRNKKQHLLQEELARRTEEIKRLRADIIEVQAQRLLAESKETRFRSVAMLRAALLLQDVDLLAVAKAFQEDVNTAGKNTCLSNTSQLFSDIQDVLRELDFCVERTIAAIPTENQQGFALKLNSTLSSYRGVFLRAFETVLTQARAQVEPLKGDLPIHQYLLTLIKALMSDPMADIAPPPEMSQISDETPDEN